MQKFIERMKELAVKYNLTIHTGLDNVLFLSQCKGQGWKGIALSVAPYGDRAIIQRAGFKDTWFVEPCTSTKFIPDEDVSVVVEIFARVFPPHDHTTCVGNVPI